MIKLLRMLRPYRLPVALVLVFVFIQSLSELYLPTLMADIVDKGVVGGDTPYIWKIGGFMLLVALAGAAVRLAQASCRPRRRAASVKIFANAYSGMSSNSRSMSSIQSALLPSSPGLRMILRRFSRCLR